MIIITGGVNLIDCVQIYGKTKETFEWPEDQVKMDCLNSIFKHKNVYINIHTNTVRDFTIMLCAKKVVRLIESLYWIL